MKYTDRTFSYALRFNTVRSINISEVLINHVMTMLWANKSSSGLRFLRETLQLLEETNA